MRGHTAERWREIDALFQATLDRDPESRSSFLAEAAAGDAALGEAVRALLAASERAGSFLEAPLVSVDEDLWREVVDEEGEAREPIEQAGAGIDRYRLLRELGRGGMGTVYLAERTDGAFEQPVALKLLRRGIDTDDVLARFRTERQILASLSHPHIARQLDGGTAADGRPYLVMEYVEGRPITAYCDALRLSLVERLRLFCVVARAVQHAHGSLVIHRDLKPSNILVTADDTVKLLDFGIAKLVGVDPSDPWTTRTGLRLFTPDYASPEQLRGEPVTTATDVYQLGVLLFRLLTGLHPGAPGGAAAGNAAGRGAPAEPPLPSDAVRHAPSGASAAEAMGLGSANRLDRRLRGDLDNIVRMALRAEPGRRYTSAGQFAEDIERHLAGRPVIARPDTPLYRARTFVRRNRTGVATVVALTLLLSAYAATVTAQSRQVARERDLARLEAAELEQLSFYLVEFFWGGDPREPMKDSAAGRLLLEQAHRRIVAMDRRPRMQARMLDVLGRVYYMLGEYDRAAPLLERALANQRRSHREPHPEVANSLASLALLHYLQGDHPTAERHGREAAGIYRELGRTDYPQYASILKYLAHTLVERGAYPEAEQVAREALKLRRGWHGDEHEEVATSLATLGRVLERGRGAREALPPFREALRLRQRVYPQEHMLVAASLRDLGNALRLDGRPAEAVPLLREASRIQRRLLGDRDPQSLATLDELASALRSLGRPAEADALLQEVGPPGTP